MKRYAGVVVLYQPDDEVVSHVKTYINAIECLYVIDNSTNYNEYVIEKLNEIPKCKYVSLDGNKGLAVALNIGCNMAKEDGFDYILTMDQDSIFEEHAVEKMIQVVENSKEHLTIVAPNVTSVYPDEKGEMKQSYTLIPRTEEKVETWVMTSGSLMNLDDYLEVGGFDEQFFIAHIDVDLGIKMHRQGMKILMYGDAMIYQRFGNSKPKKILWKTVHPWYENSLRTYYLFRNQAYMIKKYGKECKSLIHVSLVNHIVKILLFEDKKIEKLKMAYKGNKDGKNGKMGQYHG
ncbi:MAG: glycosyltransferase family 2 protein [Lachnospiraceae bacterium]|nr:glycosyltransferase family 2 protein [Lachnospiraceae bacterium]